MKVAVLLLMCIVLTLYGFHRPYKDTLTNVLELLVDLNSIFLLILISSNILEPYYSLPTKSTYSSMDCTAAAGIAAATWVILPVYYFSPLLLLILFSIKVWRIARYVCSYVQQSIH